MKIDAPESSIAGTKSAFRFGVQGMIPIMAGVAPFGFIYGAAAANAGIDLLGASAMSILVFAGAAQLVAIQLLTEHAPIFIISMTGIIINLRFMMYSASIAPHLKSASILNKIIMSYVLTDQNYAISIAAFNEKK